MALVLGTRGYPSFFGADPSHTSIHADQRLTLGSSSVDGRWASRRLVLKPEWIKTVERSSLGRGLRHFPRRAGKRWPPPCSTCSVSDLLTGIWFLLTSRSRSRRGRFEIRILP